MANSKQGRDNQADHEKRRQRERELEEARNRDDEAEPMRGDQRKQLGELDEALETYDYPATTEELTGSYGHYEVETRNGWQSLDEVLASTDNQVYVSADDVRGRILGIIGR